MRSLQTEDACADVGSVDEGVLTLWGCVIKQAVLDVGLGIRLGMITKDLVATAVRVDGNNCACREALRFLMGPDLEILTENLTAVTGVPLSRNLMMKLAREAGSKDCNTWVNRPKRTPEEIAAAAERLKAYNKRYQKVYQKAYRAKNSNAA